MSKSNISNPRALRDRSHHGKKSRDKSSATTVQMVVDQPLYAKIGETYQIFDGYIRRVQDKQMEVLQILEVVQGRLGKPLKVNQGEKVKILQGKIVEDNEGKRVEVIKGKIVEGRLGRRVEIILTGLIKDRQEDKIGSRVLVNVPGKVSKGITSSGLNKTNSKKQITTEKREVSSLLESKYMLEKLPTHIEARKQLSLVMNFLKNEKATKKLSETEDAFLKSFIDLPKVEQEEQILQLRKVASRNLG